jgi:galactitol-specific phosphotransferase system IIB component
VKPWEIVGVCLAVAVGAAVGSAIMLKEAIDRYLGDETTDISLLDQTVHG